MTTIKASISGKFRELERKLGFLVYNFSSNKRMNGACQGWVDVVVVNPKKLCIWFLEIKIGNDQHSAKQQLLMWVLKKIEDWLPANFKVVRYRVVTEKNADLIRDEIVLA